MEGVDSSREFVKDVKRIVVKVVSFFLCRLLLFNLLILNYIFSVLNSPSLVNPKNVKGIAILLDCSYISFI